jgi:hypothetical protein
MQRGRVLAAVAAVGCGVLALRGAAVQPGDVLVGNNPVSSELNQVMPEPGEPFDPNANIGV